MKAASLVGMIPADYDYPMGSVINIATQDGQDRKSVVIEADESLSKMNQEASLMMQSLVDGKPVEYAGKGVFGHNGKPTVFHKYIINRLNERYEYESILVRSLIEFENYEENFKYFQLLYNDDGTPNGKAKVGAAGYEYDGFGVLSYEDIVNRAKNAYFTKFDSQATSKTPKDRIPQVIE
jgi:hypothetical protein